MVLILLDESVHSRASTNECRLSYLSSMFTKAWWDDSSHSNEISLNHNIWSKLGTAMKVSSSDNLVSKVGEGF